MNIPVEIAGTYSVLKPSIDCPGIIKHNTTNIHQSRVKNLTYLGVLIPTLLS